MTNFKKIFLVLIIFLGLTGCSFGSKDDKKADKKKEKEPEIIIESDPLEINPALFNYTGSFKQANGDILMNTYVVTNNNSLSVEFIIPGSYFSDNSSSENDIIDHTIGFEVEQIEDNEIKIDDNDLGLTGTIKKVENGYDADLTLSDESSNIRIEGKFDKVESITEIHGYFVDGDFKAIAITPLSKDIIVSYTSVDQGYYNSKDMICEYEDSKILCEDEEENITITKVDDGIKVDTKNQKIKGNYKVKE